MKRVYKEIKPDLTLEGSTTPIKDGDIVVIKRMDKSKLVLKAVSGKCPSECMFGSASSACPYVQSVKRRMVGSDGKVIKTWRESCNRILCSYKYDAGREVIIFKSVDRILEEL